MSAITKQIAAVEFHVNARQANAALESMRQSAEDAREEMAKLQEQSDKGVKTVMVGGKDMDITKRIRDLNATAKAFEQAAQSQIKGVKAWDELWQHAKMGNIEQLTGQQIKAGVNGAKRQYDRLILGDEEDRRKAAATRDIIDQANIVLDKLKGDTDKVIQTLSDGGHVADEVLQREKKNLEDMLSLTEKFSPEWQDYNRQLQAITKGIEEQAAQEKRLRGELVDANDARREAAKLDKDVAQAAKEQHAAQQQVIDDAQKQMQQYQEQRRQHQETAQKITDEIAKQDRQIASQSQLVESIKRENHERNKKNSTLNKEAREAERTAETAKRAAEKSSKAVADTTLKISEADKKVADLQAQLKNLGNTKAKPVVDTEKIEKLKTSLKGAKDELTALMKDEQTANEKLKQFGITAADTADDVKLQAAAERALKMEEESRANLQKELIALRRRIGTEEVALSKETWGYTKLTGTKPEKAFYAKNKDVLNDEYWRDQAGGGSIGRRYKYLQDISDDSEAKAEFEENVGMSVKDAMKVAAQRMREIVQEAMKRGFRIDNAMDEFDESYGKGPAVKLADYVAEFNDMVDAREKEVIEMRREKLRNIQDIVTDPGDEPDTAQERMRLAKEDLKFMASPYGSNISSQVKQQHEEVASLEAELKKLNETGTQSVDIDKERQRITEKLNKEKEKQAKLENDLQQQTQTAKEKIEASTKADEIAAAKRDALTKAQAEGNKKLQEESQKLSQLQGAREASVASLNQEKEAIKQNNEAVDAQAKIINDAQQTQAKSRQLSIESIEKSIALLKQENRVIGDETNPQWVENEKTIGRLNERLSEMKQHAAELRGEAMSVSQAMDISYVASGSIEQMEKAISVLQEAQRTTTNDVDASRYTNAIDNLTQKLKEAKGEAVSLEEAMEMADVNSKQPYSIDEMQKGLKALQEQQNTAIDPSKYTEAIDALTQKIREAKGEAVSLEDALDFGKQGLDGSFKGTTEQLRQAKQVLESTLATTAKGSDRYKEIREALAGIAVEEKRVGEVSAEVQKILDEPKGRSFNELKVAVEQGRKELNSMTRTTKEDQKAYDELAEKVKAADLEMKNLGNESKGSASPFEKAVSRLKTYVTLYMGTDVALQKLSGLMDDTMTLSDKMGEVRKTTGFSADEVGRLSNNLAKLDTRTPIQNLMDLSAAAGQLGLNTEEDVQGFTEAANKMLVALPEMGQDGVTQMMKIALATGEVDKIRKQMENGTIEGSSATAVAMEKIASTIDRLRATTAAAAPPIVDFVKHVGAVGAQSGITVDQVAALGATVDSLGMGTNMAATAISRMIPAIKNHAFDIARAIGVTPKTIRDLYDGGKAMDVILMILQHIHDQNLNLDGIEKLLGTGGMGEIMKELDQQGARAGIVFAGLSQNVGELRKNLGTAKEAYADNIAIQHEYDKMNDTTAARWERLNNQLQEFFVNDSSQKFFGGLISALRVVVNFITDDGPIGKAFRYTVVYLAMLKAKWTEAIGSGIMYLGKLVFATEASTAASTADAAAKTFETTTTVALGNANAAAAVKTNLFTAAWHRLNAAQKANVIAAVAMAIVLLTVAAARFVAQLASMTRAQKEMNKVQDQAEEKAAEESSRLEHLRKIVNDNTRSVQERKAAILDIQKVVPNYIATVNGEGNAYKRNTDLLNNYIKKLKEKALVEGAKQEMQSLGKEIAHTTVQIAKQEKAIKDRSKEAADAMQARPQTSQGAVAPGSVQARAAASMELLQMKSKLRSLKNQNSDANDALQTLQDNFGKQIAESDLANSPGKKGNGDWNDGGTGGTGGGKGGTGGGGGTGKNSPWGANPDAASTDWKKYNGKELVARRKQMNEFVLALQGDTDVESVLSEDPALMAAMKKGKVKKDADSVIAWYDQQRLAIQDVLHSRALTNTGNWKDQKVAHQRAKSISAMVKNDMSYYMDELDAYYTEQKSQIEDAQNSGAITEEEAWRRMLENERIYRQRRAELQQLYAGKTKEVTQQEADNIYSIIADRTGDTTDFIKVNIGKTNDLIHQAGLKNAAIERKILGDLDKGTEQDFLKMRTAVKKQLDAIEEIVSKERPFDGIVKNLRQNVEKMGIIYTDLDKQKEKLILSGKGNGSDEMKALNEEYAKERPNRLTFLLKESENAYQKTGDTLLSDMRDQGFTSWADAITQSDDADKLKEALVAQLHTVYDSVQDAIKKEDSEVKKQVDIAWNDTNAPLIGGKSMKNLYEAAANALGVEQQSVSRANSLIGAGVASERVADKLAIRQLQIQLNMQEHYYAIVRKIGQQRVDDLKRQEEQYRKQGDYAKAEEAALDAKHAKMSLNLTLSEEETDLAKQRAEINARVEESQNRLYTSLKEWGTLLSSSMQSLFEASNTGAADYYNNLAKMRLTGEGSAGGTYVIIDNAGTKDAQAHYENLDGEDALKRQLEIEQQNAVADAWKKVMDDINKKISDQITDWMNAALQTQSIDANTAALEANTAALYATRPKNEGTSAPTAGKWEMGKDEDGNTLYPLQPTEEAESGGLSKWPNARRKRAGLSADGKYDAPVWQLSPLQQEDEEQHSMNTWTGYGEYGGGDETQQGASPLLSDDQMTAIADQNMQVAQSKIDASNAATEAVIAGNKAQLQSTKDTGGKMAKASKSTFSVMAQAMNMYGLAYQVMSNENMSSTQKFLTFALQSAGQVAIAMLTTNMLQTDAQSKVELPGILGKAASQLGPIAGPIAFAAMTALLGGLMAMATSKVSKSKSQISQVTGASVSAGRLSTGMLTYATGNVNEFTDPSTLTPGQQYNVDAADGHTYRARYMGANPKTHLTNGPEFHLVGERGREAIIDANTTRQLQMDDTGIWKSIQTLYNGGSIRSVRRGGMKAFATGNIDELAEGTAEQTADNGTAPATSNTDLLAALQASLDRNTEVMQKAVEHGIKGVFNVYGKDGLIDSYDRGKKNANRYGERY